MAKRSVKQEKCILEVKKKQPKICKRRGYPRKTKVGKKIIRCYNPWAVCKSKTH